MPDNYILLYKLDTSLNDVKMKNADRLLDGVARQISNKETIKIVSNGLFFSIISKLIIKSQKNTKKFKVNKDCVSCGLCSKVCSLNTIEMNNGVPKWSNKECSCCLACINRCPRKAISKGKMSIKNEHYYNKNVDIDFNI